MPKREYDDRATRVCRLIERLTASGHVPRVVEMDGLYVELAGYVAPLGSAVTSHPSSLRSNIMDTPAPIIQAIDSVSDGPTPATHGVRGYRTRAREELRRRMAEMGDD